MFVYKLVFENDQFSVSKCK